MLRDGKFIKEQPIRIGAHYVPPIHKPNTEEEWVIQHLILEGSRNNSGQRITSVGLLLVLAYTIVGSGILVINFLVENFLG